ncbi:MAG: phosphate-starvation-inducible PsiE family protein [Lamprobacter sp.]|uniref:phosphate-starvation-inducible protein PsiE n=1 Tax=Lamprobacter sp. TaxID=3100796 RepID=UPI002B26433F|nr:phosphate-starvation-inducible PsiE family protein [Lamprobacter sp.]MEA3639072.1 phosphate-starvation-inducible PsiE family protein [Lamprobacter sp.]
MGTLGLFEILGLVLITIATLVAGGQEVWQMVQAREVTLADLLLLFIYLEVLTMVGIYLESGALPVRMPLYIAIVALARHMIIGMKTMSEIQLIATSAAVLILALAVLVTRYGHAHFPYEGANQQGTKSSKDSESE